MTFTEKNEGNAIIYIINLDVAVERRKSIEQELSKTDIPYEIVSAIDKTTLDTVKHKVKNRYKRELKPAEVACFLSHSKAKELFLETQYEFAIILEDDVELLKDFDDVVKKAMKQHSTLPEKHQWDILKLPSYGRKKLFEIKEIDADYSIYGGSVGISTMGAIWTRKGAESFLQRTIQNEYFVVNMPIDCSLQTPWKYDLKIYNIVPSLIKPKDFGSHIRPERLKSSFFKRVNYERRKLLPRAYTYLKTWLSR